METKELTIFEGFKPNDVLAQKEVADDLVKKIKEAVEAEPIDLSTAKGRQAIASNAYRVAQTKTAVERAAKSLTEDMRKKVKAVNNERDRVVANLQKIQDDTRRPLNEWEAAESKRKAAIEARLDELDAGRVDAMSPSSAIREALEWLAGIDLEAGWDEYEIKAKTRADECRDRWQAALVAAEASEAQAAELEALRKAQAEREAKERAETEAKAAAEARLQEEREEQDRKLREAEERAAAAERAVAEAEARKQREEQEAADREEREKAEAIRRERELREAEDRAAERERQRVAAEKEAAERAEAKRKADADNRDRITSEITADLGGLSPIDAAEAIISGRVRHVRVTF